MREVRQVYAGPVLTEWSQGIRFHVGSGSFTIWFYSHKSPVLHFESGESPSYDEVQQAIRQARPAWASSSVIPEGGPMS